MPICRTLALGAAALMGAAACAGSATIDEIAASSTSTTTTTTATRGPDPVVAPGLIAIGGSPVRLVDSTGEPIDEAAELGVQPTWARDGSRLIVSSPDGGAGSVDVWPDGADTPVSAARSYFFFSWNHDATRVAALGPGRFGTTLDIVDSVGRTVQVAVVEAGSVFVAWEPGGRLIVHADAELLLVEPTPDDGPDDYSTRSLGPVGLGFFAAKWLPGTSEVVYATAAGVLVRHDVDTDEITELGPVRGSVALAVHPDGDRAALTHSLGTADGDTEAIAEGRVQEPAAAVEIVDLAGGARTPVLDEPALWTEWSPDGTQLLLATLDRDAHARWLLWDGETTSEVATWVPTPAFLTRYMAFSDQYIEQPRLWAPDSSAFVYPSVVVGESGDPVERIHVVPASPDARPVAIAAGSAAFWSPVAPSP